MFVLFFQVNLHGSSENSNYSKRLLIFLKKKINKTTFFISKFFNNEFNLYHFTTYFFFLIACLYATSFLPYGRFYNRLGGNVGMLLAYMYIFIFLAFYFFRRPLILEFFLNLLYNKTNYFIYIKEITIKNQK
jgi:hypothetical protein